LLATKRGHVVETKEQLNDIVERLEGITKKLNSDLKASETSKNTVIADEIELVKQGR